MPIEPPPAPASTTPSPAPAAPSAPTVPPLAPPSPGPVAPAVAPIVPADNPYAELDSAFTKAGVPPEAAQPKPSAPQPAKPAQAPSGKEPVVPKSVRDKWEAETKRLKDELKSKTEAYSSLESKIAEFEKRGKDTTILSERLAALEKQIEEKDGEIRALKQEESPEFKKKYWEPYIRFADRAKNVIEGIQIEDPETGTTRKATWKGDFARIYQLDEFSALREFKRVMGEDGGEIAMGYYRKLHEMEDVKNAALEEERKDWKQKQEAEEAQKIQTREETRKFWLQANQELSEKIDDYHDNPEDTELIEARNKALALFDAKPNTLRERIIKDAHNRQRVAAFPVLKIMIARQAKEIEDLKEQLEKKSPKPPGPTSRPGGTPSKAPEEDFESGLRKHMAGA